MGWAARANRARRLKQGGLIRVVNPAQESFAPTIRENARHCRSVVQADSAKGQHLVLCGAGPTLEDHAAEYCGQGDQVWACNGALDWLVANGHRVTHGFTVNQLDADLWSSGPDVDYLLASSTHGTIVERLVTAGRLVAFFHNFINCPEQDQLYADLYPSTVCAGSGLNAVTRALDVASYMGFDQITVLGSDCCFRGEAIHVGGGKPSWEYVPMSGVIDGRRWDMTPDMAISANWICRMSRASGGKLRVVGDHFVSAIMGKPVEFLDRLPRSVDMNGQPIPIPF